MMPELRQLLVEHGYATFTDGKYELASPAGHTGVSVLYR